ncbi:MAG TPA: hypothetical protein VLX58_05575 [Bryobacteraceae bacterium]|nr:hypothetical protein [Bryobacteraceae bacterium]
MRFAGKVLLGWVALAVIQVVTGVLVPLNAPAAANVLTWLLVTNLLIVTVLGFAAVRSGWRGWRLAIALFTVPCVIAFVNMIEGVVYLTHSGLDWRRLLLFTLIVYAAAGPVWALVFGTKRADGRPGSPSLLPRKLFDGAWRFAVSDVAYLCLYFLAGSIVFPFVRDYYATQTLPSAGTIVSLQLLLRGPLFIAVCLLLMRMIGMKRFAGALALGGAFTILSAVAPLLIPNPFFPDSVRWAHFCEVTSSDFVFGVLVGWIWGRSEVAPASVVARAA